MRFVLYELSRVSMRSARYPARSISQGGRALRARVRRGGFLADRHYIKGDGNAGLAGLEWNRAVIEVGREENHHALFRLNRADLGCDRRAETLGQAAQLEPAGLSLRRVGDNSRELA